MSETGRLLPAFFTLCLLTLSLGAAAQENPKRATASQSPLSAGGGDAAAMKICREKIGQPSATRKVGALKLLSNDTLRYRTERFQSKYVPLSNVRMYAARVVGPNFFGVEVDHLQVCFLEKTGNTYRFVQVCQTKHRSGRFNGCALGWIIPDHMRSKYPGT